MRHYNKVAFSNRCSPRTALALYWLLNVCFAVYDAILLSVTIVHVPLYRHWPVYRFMGLMATLHSASAACIIPIAWAFSRRGQRKVGTNIVAATALCGIAVTLPQPVIAIVTRLGCSPGDDPWLVTTLMSHANLGIIGALLHYVYWRGQRWVKDAHDSEL